MATNSVVLTTIINYSHYTNKLKYIRKISHIIIFKFIIISILSSMVNIIDHLILKYFTGITEF